ncbi:MAG: CAP domain-containing protein [Terriglobales bacterium]
MSRALFATITMLALSISLCLAQEVSNANQHSQPTPKFVSAQPSPTSLEDSAAEQELLDLANQRRSEAGAPPLRMDASLSSAARAHARLMVERQQLSHQFDGEPSLMPRLLDTGLRLDRVGENVAYNTSVDKAFEALMQSPPHRRNLLDPSYNSAGFAAFWSNRRLYVVQDFAHQLPAISNTSSQ